MDLNQDIKFLKGVGPKKAMRLKDEVNISTLNDLITYYPYKYVDRSRFYTIKELNDTLGTIQIKGQLRHLKIVGENRSKRLIGTFTDGENFIELIWFKMIKYISKELLEGQYYIVFGKPSKFNNQYNIVHPEMEVLTQENMDKLSGWQGTYLTTEKMKLSYLSSKHIYKLIQSALASLPPLDETLPLDMVQGLRLLSRDKAIRWIHNPPSEQAITEAKYRLKFEELFYIQLNIALQSIERHKVDQGFLFSKVGPLFNHFYQDKLPFSLTGAQKRVLKEIHHDMQTGQQMNRLLQGDVGSGKTMVALMTCLLALDNGFQACIMAPTEILAQQHFESISQMVEGLEINVALLTGSTKVALRRSIHKTLEAGTLNILIGTHALIEDKVKFHNLGLVVIDEQHRFGVAQRAKLWKKNTLPPHILVMTATPIPRTLAMTIYSDLQISIIDELPPGRKPIATYHYFDNKREKLYTFLEKQIQQGSQIYLVYPLIEESKQLDFADLMTAYETIKKRFSAYSISMVHGRLKPEVKKEEMTKFALGETQILMATTVIEVGVNVPNASVMVIESAERFGLSQLHQLRGRVGRGKTQSYCILMTKYALGNESQKRLQIMCDSNDGFEIAEADLALRGPGNLEGTMQSGLPFQLKIANLARDGQLLQLARNTTQKLLKIDPKLQRYPLLKTQLKALKKDPTDWSLIS